MAQRGPQAGRSSGRSRRSLAALGVAMVAGGAIVTTMLDPASAASPPNVFMVAKYPVQAQAGDAVTAKAQALADGQQGALRSLMKRLVPVTAYKRLPKVPLARVQDMVAGFSVRSERNSSTEYLASYDFEFQARAVRELLRSNGLTPVEDMAPATVLIAAYGTPSAAGAPPVATKGGKAVTSPAAGSLPAHVTPVRAGPLWTKAWSDLDLEHALTPLRMRPSTEALSDDSLRRALGGDWTTLRGMAGSDTNSERTVLAYAEPTADGRRMKVTLTGRDAVGWVGVTRTYPILDGDTSYVAELAAVVGLGILEGRWKALKSSRSGTGTVSADGVDGWNTTSDREGRGDQITAASASSAGWTDDIEVVVEFRGLGQWQQMRRQLLETPGVEDLEVGQMSARAASIKLRYPGGAERLAGDLGGQGMNLSRQGGQWVLQAR